MSGVSECTATRPCPELDLDHVRWFGRCWHWDGDQATVTDDLDLPPCSTCAGEGWVQSNWDDGPVHVPCHCQMAT